MRAITWAAAATAILALTLTGCGTSNSDGGIAGNSGNGDSYAGVVTSSEAGPVGDGQVLVGVGDDSHLPPPYLTIAAGSQVTAECHGPTQQPPQTVTVTTADGWKVQLTHGSQTITAENAQIPAPPGQISTPQTWIDSDLEQNADDLATLGYSSVYTDGITWDKPSPGHIEVQINQENVPAEWARLPEFKMYMHINCGGDQTTASSSTTTRAPK